MTLYSTEITDFSFDISLSINLILLTNICILCKSVCVTLNSYSQTINAYLDAEEGIGSTTKKQTQIHMITPIKVVILQGNASKGSFTTTASNTKHRPEVGIFRLAQSDLKTTKILNM